MTRASRASRLVRLRASWQAGEVKPTRQQNSWKGPHVDQINPCANSFADVIGNIADAGLTAGDVMNAFGTRRWRPDAWHCSTKARRVLEEYERAVTGTSTASKMYAIQNDTLEVWTGSRVRLKSAQIEFVEEFTPIMRAFLGILTDITIKVADLPGPLKGVLWCVACRHSCYHGV